MLVRYLYAVVYVKLLGTIEFRGVIFEDQNMGNAVIKSHE